MAGLVLVSAAAGGIGGFAVGVVHAVPGPTGPPGPPGLVGPPGAAGPRVVVTPDQTPRGVCLVIDTTTNYNAIPRLTYVTDVRPGQAPVLGRCREGIYVPVG